MRSIFTLVFLSINLAVFAQITYTANDGPKIGLRVKDEYLEDLSGFDLQDYTKAGGNQSWEVTGSTQDGSPFEYIGVANLDFKSLFPGANMAQQEVPNPDSSYSMYLKDNTGLYLVGVYNPGQVIVFSNKVKILPYPTTYGTNFQNDVTATFDAGGFPAQMDIKTNSTVDAWGVMKTKEGSFPCLKLKHIQLAEISVLGIPFGSQTLESHEWLASGYGEPVASLSFAEVEDQSGIINDTTFAILREHEVVANRELSHSALQLQLSPNPSLGQLLIQCPGLDYNEASYNIIDINGKTVVQGIARNNEKIQLNIEHLSAGAYLVQLVLDKKTLLFDILNKQ